MIFGSGGFGLIPLNGAGGGTPGPPFDPTSADNGLSVDAITGRIVFGNDTGDSLATLLSNREIPMDGFSVEFTKAIGSISLSGGNNDGGITDVTTNNFYAAFTGLNRSTGAAALAYSGVYNDQNNAILLISTGTGYVSGGTSYEPNALMLYGDSNGSPVADMYIAGDANMRFLTQGLNRSFEKMTLFASGNFRLAGDGIDSFTAKMQIRGDIDNIIDFEQADGQSRAVFGNTGNLIIAPGAAGTTDVGTAIQLYLDANQPAMLIRDQLGVDVFQFFDGGSAAFGTNGGADAGAQLQVWSDAGKDVIFFGTTGGNTVWLLDRFGRWFVPNGFTNWNETDPVGIMMWNGSDSEVQQFSSGFTGTFMAGVQTVTVKQGIITSVV